MSDKSAEYLKRTCLICGCHTNQTINIYEPRSGPNIVELIQAKFKFQPLNEDKYLCYSCNNWLINWHSLQALNSNDADESPSGNFRSHINNMVQEKGAGSQRSVAVCRPMQRETTAARQTTNAATAAVPAIIAKSHKSADGVTPFYGKRSFQRSYRIQHKTLQTCCVCGRAIVLRMRRRAALNRVAAPLKKSLAARCRKCRHVCRWRAVYMQSLAHSERRRAQVLPQKSLPQQQQRVASVKPLQTQLVNGQQEEESHDERTAHRAAHQRNLRYHHQPSQQLQRPRVDGKIVSMLRRLGTTLSREANDTTDTASPMTRSLTQLPPIMSPAKQKPRWLRPLASDEILLDFNTTISEVFPSLCGGADGEGAVMQQQQQQTRRKLTYQMTMASIDVDSNSDADDDESVQLHQVLPQGLCVTLV